MGTVARSFKIPIGPQPMRLRVGEASLDEIRERFGWTTDELTRAIAEAGFPKSEQRFFDPIAGDPRIEHVWLRNLVDRWELAVAELVCKRK